VSLVVFESKAKILNSCHFTVVQCTIQFPQKIFTCPRCIASPHITRQRNNLYLPQENLTIYQKGAYYSGIKIFNNLPSKIKNVAGNQKKFKIALKKFLYAYSFYTLEEYFS